MRPLFFLLAACTDPQGASPSTPDEALDCTGIAVVTDIDETLTTADTEWLAQLGNADYDPKERPDAATLMRGYADKGYTVLYVTARGEDLAPTGATARELTVGWLETHGYPVDSENVVLADGIGALGDAAGPYKIDALQGFVDEGWIFPYGYGNADTDMLAFETVVDPERLYLVGELTDDPDFATYLPISDADAYTAHLAALDDVPDCTTWR